MENINQYKPVELCQVLISYTENGMMDDEMIEVFQQQFKGRYEQMKPEDSAAFYYCYTKLGHLGEGEFYKYL